MSVNWSWHDQAAAKITADEYQQLAARTLIAQEDIEMTQEDNSIVWNAVGLGGEAGEILELVKKGLFHRHVYQHPLGLGDGFVEFQQKMSKELGDCLWYIAALCTRLDIRMGDIMVENIDKLRARYPEGWDEKRSLLGKRADILAEERKEDAKKEGDANGK
jgi:NTP pyrophosphatase (non-canonical NTP hydrolase)